MRRLGPDSESVTRATGVGAGKTGSNLFSQIGRGAGTVIGGAISTYVGAGPAPGASIGGSLGGALGSLGDSLANDESTGAALTKSGQMAMGAAPAIASQIDGDKATEFARELLRRGAA